MNGPWAGSAGDWLPALLPLAVFGLLFANLRRWWSDWREAWVVATVVWGTLVTGFSEGLSLFRHLTTPSLAVLWLTVGLALAGGLRLRPVARRAERARRSGSRGLPWGIGVLAVWLAGLGLVALTAAPNAFDAMTYHLPRVMHWIQDRSVGYYPTSIQRQLYLSPWAEYAVLQFQLLLGADRLANGVQWFSLVTCVVGVSLVARQLGAGARGQLLAALLAATIPMAVLQSTSSQTDLAASCWLVATVWLLLSAVESPAPDGRRSAELALAGLALGLGVLTKATNYCFGLLPCLWLAVILLRRHRGRALPRLAIFAALILIVNLPTYVREIRTYRSPFGPGQVAADGPTPAAPYGNASHTPAAVVSNALRNAALELTSPSRSLTRLVEFTTRALLQAAGIDPDDPRTSWVGYRFALSSHVWANENFAGSPLQLLLILGAGAVLVLRRRGRAGPWRPYALMLLGGWLVFAFLLRWTIWNTRLLLPLLILGMPLVALALDRLRPAWLAAGVTAAAFAYAVPVAVRNPAHPLTGPRAYFRLNRMDQYYLTAAPQLAAIHGEVTRLVAALHPARIGLRLGRDDWEYPLWLRFRAAGLDPRIEHVDVHNASARYAAALPPFVPDVIVTIKLAEHQVRVAPAPPRPVTPGSPAGA